MKKDYSLMKDISEDNIVDLGKARAGLITGGGDDENWLAKLPIGSVFLSRRKTAPKDQMFKDLYCVLDHKRHHTSLMQKIPNGQTAEFWFETLEFSRANFFGEIIAQVEVPERFGEEQEQQEQETPLKETTNDGEGSV